jgi:hypothetical protein
MKQKIESEYMEVAADARCEIPLIQAAKVIGLEEDGLPVIKVCADWLADNFEWLENEKSKGLFFYNSQITKTENYLIELYPKVKTKLKLVYKEMYNQKKHKKVGSFVNAALILELHHKMDLIGDKPVILRETLH